MNWSTVGLVALDDAKGKPFMREAFRDGPRGSSETAKDVVSLELRQLLPHTSSPEPAEELSLQHDLSQPRERVDRRCEPAHDEKAREDPAGGRKCVNLTESHGGDCDDGHEQRRRRTANARSK